MSPSSSWRCSRVAERAALVARVPTPGRPRGSRSPARACCQLALLGLDHVARPPRACGLRTTSSSRASARTASSARARLSTIAESCSPIAAHVVGAHEQVVEAVGLEDDATACRAGRTCRSRPGARPARPARAAAPCAAAGIARARAGSAPARARAVRAWRRACSRRSPRAGAATPISRVERADPAAQRADVGRQHALLAPRACSSFAACLSLDVRLDRLQRRGRDALGRSADERQARRAAAQRRAARLRVPWRARVGCVDAPASCRRPRVLDHYLSFQRLRG